MFFQTNSNPRANAANTEKCCNGIQTAVGKLSSMKAPGCRGPSSPNNLVVNWAPLPKFKSTETQRQATNLVIVGYSFACMASSTAIGLPL